MGPVPVVVPTETPVVGPVPVLLPETPAVGPVLVFLAEKAVGAVAGVGELGQGLSPPPLRLTWA